MATRVLYVGGMPRSGSTLLTWMLGELPGHVAVGELFYLWSAGIQRDQLCGCGEPFSACPFWTEVGCRAFGGWSEVDVDRAVALTHEVDSTRRLPRILAARFLPSFRRRRDAYLDLLARVYAAVSETAGGSVVVDGSKRPSLAFLLRASTRLDVRVVHILRDPRGVVHSWSKQVTLPEGAGVRGYLKVRSTRLIVRRWLTVTALFGLLRRLGVPVTTIRYEDLAGDPHGALRDLLDFCDVPVDPDPTAFIRADGLHLTRAHMVEGGRVRFTDLPLVMRLDEAWRTEMPAGRQRAVGLATWLPRRRRGYS